ncbi:thiamine pyrophosphate-dependent enzyme [Streptomyces sp. DH37]|uniref:thiamine pyrophosphate-dependent enzyme n=1 Tax=Streptomyces sp. DH37 TaxID=3040122 RepID=UPI0024415A5F|nr:thiamine pyrophosphate-dependent enzyme [Streptomyces sp. DH37]MDG9703201.1 thiamine pyrophosphate-binding protein [Streptomyces sp. DH37]
MPAAVNAERAAEPPTVARTVAASLRGHDVDRVFCVAGESYLPVLDALYDMPEVDVVTCRHEGSAAFMALADAKLTGRAGVCLVSRGPGAANAAIAVHAAAEDASPLVLLVGGVPVREEDREPFQGIDLSRHFSGMAKAVWTLREPGTAAEFLGRAVHLAEAGTPGPVVLCVPEDVWALPDPVGTPSRRTVAGPAVPDWESSRRIRELLANARRPLLIAGARLEGPEGRRLVRDIAERHRIPVVTSNKNQHLLPNRHPAYAGHLHNATQDDQLAALERADLVLAVGTRLDGTTTRRRRFPAAPEPRRPLVHIYPDAERIGAFHRPDVAVAADPVAFLRQLTGWSPSDPGGERARWTAELHAIEVEKARWHPVEADDGVVFGAVAAALDELTGGDATVVVDSGTFTSWTYRHVRFGERGRLLGISSSSMGFAVGAGVSAALRATGVPTVVVVGDGGFLMNGGELITACARGLPVVYIVANNGSYGTIRRHQDKDFPGRTIATDLDNPDFGRLAEAHGALGLTAHTPSEVRPCLAKALEHGGPAVLEVRTSLRYSNPYRRPAGDGSAAHGPGRGNTAAGTANGGGTHAMP